MNSRRVFLHLKTALVAIAALTVLSGCGKSEEEEAREREERDRARLERVARFSGRVQQLEETLDLLDRDVDIQRGRIRTARADLEAIKENLKSYSRNPFPIPDITTATASAFFDEDYRKENKRREEQAKDDENRAISTLLLLAFIAFFVVWFGKMWRDRKQSPETVDDVRSWESAPAAPPSPHASAESAGAGSGSTYTYPSAGATPATEPMSGAEGGTRSDEERADDKPPSAF